MQRRCIVSLNRTFQKSNKIRVIWVVKDTGRAMGIEPMKPGLEPEIQLLLLYKIAVDFPCKESIIVTRLLIKPAEFKRPLLAGSRW